MTEQGVVWIKTEPSVDGKTYVATLEIDQDTAMVLTPENAMKHASAVLTEIFRAESEVAILKQLTSTGVEQKHAAETIMELREDQPPLDWPSPLSLTHGVNPQRKPFLVVNVGDKRVGQWEVPDAKEHALAVLSIAEAANFDALYYRQLIGTIGLKEDNARAVVAALADFR